ncbi:hypothetical protein HAX54_001882, partial [Datura stramonium]|nr:hypothetical protein [Datura stramonium]
MGKLLIFLCLTAQTTACRNCPLWGSPLTVLKYVYKGEGLNVLAEVCPTTGPTPILIPTVTAQTTACRNCPLWGSPLTVLKRVYKGEPRLPLVEIVRFGARPSRFYNASTRERDSTSSLRCRAVGGANLSEEAESLRGTRFKTVRGEPQRGKFLQAVVWDFTVTRDGDTWYQSRCRADGGTNLSEDAESLRGTRFKTVRGVPQSGQFLQAVVWAVTIGIRAGAGPVVGQTSARTLSPYGG